MTATTTHYAISYKAPPAKPSLAPSTCTISTVAAAISLWITPPSATAYSWSMSPAAAPYLRADPADIARSELTQTIFAFKARSENWDGRGGRPPTANAVSDAIRFLDLVPSHYPIPRTFSAGDGEVALVWESGDRYVEVGFFGDGTIAFAARLAPGVPAQSGEIDYSGMSIPFEIQASLASVTR